MADKDKKLITIFRGVHLLDMANELSPQLSDMDIICCELVGNRAEHDNMDQLLNAFSSNEAFVANQDPAQWEAYPHPYVRLAWQLRGSNKKFYTVDEITP